MLVLFVLVDLKSNEKNPIKTHKDFPPEKKK